MRGVPRPKQNINALEQGLLQTNYPALRDALAQDLEAAVKKKSRKNAKG